MARAVRCAIAALALLSCQRDADGPLFPESLAPVSYLRKQDRLSRLEQFGAAERASTPAVTTLPGPSRAARC